MRFAIDLLGNDHYTYTRFPALVKTVNVIIHALNYVHIKFKDDL